MRILKSLLWIIPCSLVCGAGLSALDGGTWWVGFLAYSFIMILGLLVINLFWQSAGMPRGLVIMLVLAFLLRFTVGVFFSWALPVYGNDSEVHNAGYIFRDALTYDSQSWNLASSGDPLWKVFDRSYGIEEQYGGLTLTLSLLYRSLSPDFHRQWLTILLLAFVGAAGVAMSWKAARLAWGTTMGWLVGWIMALYPESLLAGASQIREPFLALFISTAFWGLADWTKNQHRAGWLWALAGFLLSLLFSPGVAIFALVVLGGWFWFVQKERHIRWWWAVGGATLVVLGTLLMGVLVSGTLQAPAGPLANLVNWLRYSASYGAYETELNSGWIQSLFKILPGWLHLPFITVYGVTQPLLPAAIADPAAWPSRLLGIMRGLGWYALLPFLMYSLYPILKQSEKKARWAWLSIWVTAWIWILVCSFRAGGDQWDNPRYRLMMLFFQAGLMGFSLIWARQARDQWLRRVFIVEGIFLVLFGYWYFARYTQWETGQVHVLVIMLAIALLSAIVLGGGWLLDRHKRKKA